jgi:hypothetical protein
MLRITSTFRHRRPDLGASRLNDPGYASAFHSS